jgi:hypothetical protein
MWAELGVDGGGWLVEKCLPLLQAGATRAAAAAVRLHKITRMHKTIAYEMHAAGLDCEYFCIYTTLTYAAKHDYSTAPALHFGLVSTPS